MKSEYDVIVVGAGPAGSVAAYTAARQGLDVLLLEKRQEIGVPVRCAEGIIKEGLDDFIEYDPRWVCADIRRARFHSPDGGLISFSQKQDETAGYVLDRKIFDRALAKKAAIEGSEIRVKTQATGLLEEGHKIVGIKGISRGNIFEARSRVIIGADGVESKVGRWAGLLSPLKLKDIGSCAEFLLSGVDIDQDCLDFYLGSDICPGGYLWIFPKGDMEANVGLGISGTKFKGMHPIEYLKKFVDARFAGAKIIQTMAGGVPICDMNGRISTGGLMLAGDGARLVDPLIGAGIMNAMISGRMAGKRAVEAIEKGDVSYLELMKYDLEVRESMGKAIHRNYLIKELLVNASDRQLNALFGSLRRTNLENMPVTSLYKTATTKGLPILKVMRALI
jgi:digeranylgeranylglycerophospholipid reductase